MSDKQFEVLIGISQNMEKSLANIEKSMSEKKTGGGGGKKTSGAADALGGLASNLQAPVS